MKKNTRIRDYAKANEVKLWEIAVKLGISKGNFLRKLRMDLPQDLTDQIMAVIDTIAEEHSQQRGGH